jgi:2-iminobutanoate/2-iminopropanoate deaminase
MIAISTTGAPPPKGHYSQAIEHAGLVFVTAQNGTDPTTGQLVEGVAEQTEQALRNIERILNEAGGGLANVVRVGLYLVDIADLLIVNAAYAERFGDDRPARSTLQVAGLPGGARVAIDVIAAA